jgi:hypothetical protein
LFAPDGSMLQCTDKFKLIHNLEKLAKIEETNEQTETPPANAQDDKIDPVLLSATSSSNPKISIVEGIVLGQKTMKKTETLSTVSGAF